MKCAAKESCNDDSDRQLLDGVHEMQCRVSSTCVSDVHGATMAIALPRRMRVVVSKYATAAVECDSRMFDHYTNVGHLTVSNIHNDVKQHDISGLAGSFVCCEAVE